jgi:hypothetical protein
MKWNDERRGMLRKLFEKEEDVKIDYSTAEDYTAWLEEKLILEREGRGAMRPTNRNTITVKELLINEFDISEKEFLAKYNISIDELCDNFTDITATWLSIHFGNSTYFWINAKENENANKI